MIGNMQRGIGRLIIANLSTEILYSFFIILCSLMIYFGTKELYELSSHKGIKYFRISFLFFALAYFFRSFIKLFIFHFNVQAILYIPTRLLNPVIANLTLILFMYFSSMAIFYLMYSVLYKKWNSGNKVYPFHIFAIFISLFSVFSVNPYSYIRLNLILLFFIITVVFISYNDSKRKKSKKNNLYAIYILLLFFWLLNILDILIPNIFQTSQLFIYLASSGIFLTILFKVLRKAGN